jgi:putative ABC transport system permease protein
MMRFRPDLYSRLRELIWGARIEADVDEEFRAHLALRTEALRAAGLPEREARAEALRRFGDVGRFQAETAAIDHEAERERKRMEIVDSLRRELRHAARALLRARGFAVTTVLTLGLGIGASTAVFTMLDAVVLRPLPYHTSDRLARIDHPVPGVKAGSTWETASATYYHYTDQTRLFESVGAYVPMELTVRGLSEASRVRAARVTASLFDVLRARPAAGRLLEESDDFPDSPRVVLGYDYWQRAFGGDPAVAGKTIEIEGIAFEIVGVAERGFSLPDRPTDIYIARGLQRTMEHRNWHHLHTLARLRPGITPELAQQELRTRQTQLVETYPGVYSESFFESTGFAARVQDLRAHVIGNMGRILWILLGAVGVVLVIACANVANLFLVRAESRSNEASIRVALGAGRTHLVLQSMAESVLLTLVAALVGVWFAALSLRLLLALAPSTLPRLDEVGLAGNAVWFALVLALTTGSVFGLFPVVRPRLSFAPLREGGRGLTTGRAQLHARSVLITAQIALALVLLAGSGLILRSFDRLRRLDTGIQEQNVLVADVSIPFGRYSTYAASTQFWRALMERLQALPGVTHAGAVSDVPLDGGKMACAILWTAPFAAEGEVPGCINTQTVTPGFFEALGVPVRGRFPGWNDIAAQTGAIVITNALAQRLWPGQDAVGKGIRGNNRGPVYYQIVGVIGDVRAEGLNRPPSEIVYFPSLPLKGAPLWGVATSLSVAIKLQSGDATTIAPALRRLLSELEPAAALGSLRTMEQIVTRSVSQTTFTMILLGISGLMALLISVVGLYGVITYVVNSRRAEIGVRMALGARAGAVAGRIVLHSIRLGAIGIAIGLPGAFLANRSLASLLFEVQPTDPLTLTAVSLILLSTCAVASFFPARRAARVSPVEALKS